MAGILTRKGRQFVCKQLTAGRDDLTYLLGMRLFTAASSPGVNPSPGAFTEAAFGGYAAIPFPIEDNGAPTLDTDDYITLLSDASFIWNCGNPTETILGWYLLSEDGLDVLAYEVYATPHVLEIGSQHTLFASVKIGQCP